MDPEKITFFGETDSRGKRVRFGIKAKDRTKHIYVIGKTGMGKSTLLENMAIQDIQNGEGMAFLDPHGSTAEKLLNYVPPERLDDVVYFAPFDVENPISFNVLEDVGIDKRHLVVAGLMSTFKKIWLDAWSARMEYILTNSLLALIEYPGATLLGVNKLLSDKEYRKKVVDNVKDVSVKSFWVDEFAKYTDKTVSEAIPAIQNKIGQFTANPLIRNIVGQPKSSFDIRQLMDDKKILIINLSKGMVGETNAKLLGSMMITKIYLAAMSRANIQQKELNKLPNFYLYVDEFQSFANESFADILSEARKYKLNLTIAHQYIEQMSEEVRAAVFGNAGTEITFRVGAIDAEVLEKEFAPQFTAEDLVNLGMYQMYLKLMIDGVGSVPFSASSLPPFPEPVISYRTEIIEHSRNNFSKKRAEVEEIIRKWNEEAKSSMKVFVTPKPVSSTARAYSGPALTSTAPKITTEKSEMKKPYLAHGTPAPEIKRVYQAPVVSAPEVKKVYEPKAAPIMSVIKKVYPVKFDSHLAGNETPKPVIPKYEKSFPPIEDSTDDFVPLKELAKKLVVETKIYPPKQDFGVTKIQGNHSKIMSKENLSDLRSALDAVMKKTNVNVSKDTTPEPQKGPLKPIKAENDSKPIKSKKTKIEPKNTDKKEDSNVAKTTEISEDELKKVLGL